MSLLCVMLSRLMHIIIIFDPGWLCCVRQMRFTELLSLSYWSFGNSTNQCVDMRGFLMHKHYIRPTQLWRECCCFCHYFAFMCLHFFDGNCPSGLIDLRRPPQKTTIRLCYTIKSRLQARRDAVFNNKNNNVTMNRGIFAVLSSADLEMTAECLNWGASVRSLWGKQMLLSTVHLEIRMSRCHSSDYTDVCVWLWICVFWVCTAHSLCRKR